MQTGMAMTRDAGPWAMADRAAQAIRRCRYFVLSIFLTYVVSSGIGVGMAHGGNDVALSKRDEVVGRAIASDRSTAAYRSGNQLRAAGLDFTANLFLAAIPQTVAGLGVVPPYFSVAYQGWIGGIVSVSNAHESRFRTLKGGSYYVLVLLLQFIPFSLAIGGGVRCGLELYRQNVGSGWNVRSYRVPRESLVDVAVLYAVAIPLFFLASAFEFLSPWNL